MYIPAVVSLHIHFLLDLNEFSAAVCMTLRETQTSQFKTTKNNKSILQEESLGTEKYKEERLQY